MKRLFDNDNAFFKAMNVAFSLIVINLLTILCCLPIVTIGAAVTAADASLARIVMREEGYPSRQFFQAFRRNLRQGVLSFLVFLLLGCILGVDLYGTLTFFHGAYRRIFLGTTAVLSVVCLVLFQYFYIFLCRYRDSSSTTMKNAAIASVAYLPRTLGMLVIWAASIFLYLRFLVYAVPFLVLLGFSLPQYCCALLYVPMFRLIEGGR